MKYSFKDFLDGKVVVTTASAEETDAFVKACDEANVLYGPGAKMSQWVDRNARRKGYSVRNHGDWLEGALGALSDPALPRVNFSDLLLHTPADFFAGRIGIRCETRAEYDALMRECEGKGLRWCTGDKAQTPREQIYPIPPIPCHVAANALPSSDHRSLYARATDRDMIGPVPCVPFSALFPAPVSEPVKPEPVKYKVGDLFTVIETGGHDFAIGDVVRMEKRKWPDASDCVRVSDGHEQFIYDIRLKPYAPPAPYDGRGKHKVGDRFEVIKPGTFNVGDIVRLCRDDGTINPEFERIPDGYRAFKSWGLLKPLPAPLPRIEITTDGRVTTATLYEGGEAVRTGTAECDGRADSFVFAGATTAYNRLRFGQDFNSPNFGEFMALYRKMADLSAEIGKAVHK